MSTEEDSLVAIENQIETLSEALESPYDLMSILDEDLDLESISQFQIHNLNRKVNLLHTTFVIAAREMAGLQNWSLICEKSIAIGKQMMGKAALIHEKILRYSFLEFCEERKFKVHTIKRTLYHHFYLITWISKIRLKSLHERI